MQNTHKVLFAGSGEFSWPVLEGLLDNSKYEVVGILTQPHKPVGREQKPTPALLEQTLLRKRPEVLQTVPIFHPEKLKSEAQSILDQTNPDVVVVAAYGQIIPNNMLEFNELGCVNFHGSLLPKLRGAVPVPMAILQGFTETGVTLQKVVAELDAGPIIAASKTNISPDETAATLMSRLGDIAKQMVGKELVEYVEQRATLTEQNYEEATFCYTSDIAKDKAEITVMTPLEIAERKVRAFNPWPVAWVQLRVNNSVKRLKIFASEAVQSGEAADIEVGKITKIGKELYLRFTDGTLKLTELQLEGKQKGSAVNYLFLSGATLA